MGYVEVFLRRGTGPKTGYEDGNIPAYECPSGWPTYRIFLIWPSHEIPRNLGDGEFPAERGKKEIV